jgi:outer membrane protein assembly factor BamB
MPLDVRAPIIGIRINAIALPVRKWNSPSEKILHSSPFWQIGELHSVRPKIVASAGILLMLLATMQPPDSEASASTFEAWDFNTLGEVLALSPTNDVSGDGIDELVVAVKQFIFLIDGATGEDIWTYNVNNAFTWIAAVTVDVNDDDRPDVLAAADNGLVMRLDGASGKQVWNFTSEGTHKPGDLCYSSARFFHLVSDINDDGVSDAVVVSGSGDQCPKDDEFSVMAIDAKSGKKIWEYVHEEDYHGLKDGTRARSPVALIDFNRDGNEDVAIVDDSGTLYVIDGSAGDVIKTEELDIFGSIWNFIVIPDISGNNIEDVIAFEFIDGAGGPDYASIDAIDLVAGEVLWQLKVGDGLYDGGALYSMTWLASGDSTQTPVNIAVTQRVENKLDLLLLDGITGREIWRFDLGEDKTRNDMDKYYPIASVPDLNGNAYDEITVGSIGATIYLLDTKDPDVLWSHSVGGGGTMISSIQISDDQRYILVGDRESRLNALAGRTVIETGLTIRASEQTTLLSRKIIISGAISPSLPGEVVQLRYVDPTGFVISRPLVIAQDGSYTDEIEPKVIGNWRASVSFAGKGYYTDSQSPTISFSIENETRNSVYKLEIESDDNTVVSYPVVYLIEGGQVDKMSIDRDRKSLDITITAEDQGSLRLELSRNMIDAWDSSYEVYVDGEVVEYDEVKADTQTRTLSIPFSASSEQIQVIGTYVVPEFPMASLMLVLTIAGTITIMAIWNRLFTKYE